MLSIGDVQLTAVGLPQLVESGQGRCTKTGRGVGSAARLSPKGKRDILVAKGSIKVGGEN